MEIRMITEICGCDENAIVFERDGVRDSFVTPKIVSMEETRRRLLEKYSVKEPEPGPETEPDTSMAPEPEPGPEVIPEQTPEANEAKPMKIQTVSKGGGKK